MRLFPRVPAHVDDQHILGLEGPLLARTLLPVAHKLFLLAVDVLVVDVLHGMEGEKKKNLGFWTHSILLSIELVLT